METGIPYLDELLALRALSRTELLERLGPATYEGEGEYQNLEGVTRMDLAGDPRPTFYLSGDAVELIHAGAGEHPELTDASLEEVLGAPPLILRSRAGKPHRLLVYPEQGIALSSRSGAEEADFVDVFAPRSAKAYQREIYKDPGLFIR